MFSVEDLHALVPERSDKSFSEGLRRLVRQGVLERPLGAPKGLSRNDRSNRSTIREPLACPRVTSVCTCFMCRIRADVAGAPERTMAHVPGSR